MKNITEIKKPNDVIRNAGEILGGSCSLPKIKAAETVMSGTDWPALVADALDHNEGAIGTLMTYLCFVATALKEASEDNAMVEPYIKGSLIHGGPSTNTFGNN
jgi:hypothetical protein